MTNIEKLNELGISVEPVGSCSNKYYLMVDEKWLYSECKPKIDKAESEET